METAGVRYDSDIARSAANNDLERLTRILEQCACTGNPSVFKSSEYASKLVDVFSETQASLKSYYTSQLVVAFGTAIESGHFEAFQLLYNWVLQNYCSKNESLLKNVDNYPFSNIKIHLQVAISLGHMEIVEKLRELFGTDIFNKILPRTTLVSSLIARSAIGVSSELLQEFSLNSITKAEFLQEISSKNEIYWGNFKIFEYFSKSEPFTASEIHQFISNQELVSYYRSYDGPEFIRACESFVSPQDLQEVIQSIWKPLQLKSLISRINAVPEYILATPPDNLTTNLYEFIKDCVAVWKSAPFSVTVLKELSTSSNSRELLIKSLELYDLLQTTDGFNNSERVNLDFYDFLTKLIKVAALRIHTAEAYDFIDQSVTFNVPVPFHDFFNSKIESKDSVYIPEALFFRMLKLISNSHESINEILNTTKLRSGSFSPTEKKILLLLGQNNLNFELFETFTKSEKLLDLLEKGLISSEEEALEVSKHLESKTKPTRVKL